MKRELTGALAGIALILILGAGRKYIEVQKVYQNEGDLLAPISVTCLDSAWTAIAPASKKRRAVVLQSLVASASGVCISTATGGACSDGQGGFELEPGMTVTDNSEALLNCRSRTGSIVIKGMSYSDSED